MYFNDNADDQATCQYKAGCDVNRKYPYTDAKADDAEALTFSGCHDNSGAGNACDPTQGEIWSTDQTKCVHDPALPVCPQGKVLAMVGAELNLGFHCKDE